MRCLHPIEVKKYSEETNARGRHLKVNNYHLVPCGKCVACLARRRNEWTYRLSAEQASSDYTYFVTLTYDDANVPIRVQDGRPYYVFDKEHVQKYIKRVRHFCRKFDISISYFLVSEFGGHTHRPHYHALIFAKDEKNDKFNILRKILLDEWGHGFVTIKPANPANIHYVTKYCVKSLQESFEDCIDETFTLCSKKNYLGKGYEDLLGSQNEDFIKDPVVFYQGFPMVMPRIYRQKLGLGVSSEKSSPNPCLSQDKYDQFVLEYKNRFKTFDQVKFDIWLNKRLRYYEERAKQKQLNRLEKL